MTVVVKDKAYYTSTDLITEALASIGALSPGQPTDVEDFSYVAGRIGSILSLIDGLDIVQIPDVENIPAAYFAPLSDIVAGECCMKFGVSTEDYTNLKLNGLGGVPNPQGKMVEPGDGAAAKVLKQLRRLQPTGEIVQSDFF
jgi:hypothetical protein